MSVFEKSRYKIISKAQHLFRHKATNFVYSNPTMPGVANVTGALNYIAGVLYPNSKDSVATPAALPLVGNTINDYRVVEDDGDGKAAGYRWEQREGDVAASWYKIYDMDWGMDSVLSQFLNRTQEVYVYKHGTDDLDSTGTPIAGDLAGQHIYGGASAGTHLTLFANSGDGVGADTGYVQLGDQFRPVPGVSIDIGNTTNKFNKGWFTTLNVNTMDFSTGSITDTTGAIFFGDEDLSTTGSMGAASFSDTTPSSFTSGATIGTLTLADGSITDSGGSISFGDEDLSTTGNVGGLTANFTTVNGGNLRIAGNVLSSTDTDGNITLTPDGTGQIYFSSQANGSALVLSGLMQSLTASVGTMSIAGGSITDSSGAISFGDENLTTTGLLNAGNLRLSGNTLLSTNTDGNVIIDPDGAGLIEFGAAVFPTTTSAWDIGKSGNVWNDLWIDGNITDGSNSISITNLLTFRAVGSPNVGDALFWDGDKWVASNPDSEIVHGELSTLDADDHTQYALLAGRVGGQTLVGGTAASENLYLESTAHGTKGSVVFKDTLSPNGDNSVDIGDTSNYVKDLYIKGELKSARLENFTTAGRPAASASNKGRLIWDTDVLDIFVDIGGAWLGVSQDKWMYQDATTWDGATFTQTYTVDGSVSPERGRVSDARFCIWALMDNSGSFIEVECDITKTATQVTVTVDTALPAGTYTLIGIG